MQSKQKSFIESLVNTFIGFIVTWICSPLIYWIAGLHPNYGQISILTLLFTILSVIRNYVIRRWFNKIR